MLFRAENLRSHLLRLKPLLNKSSLEQTRKWQECLGELMAVPHHNRIVCKPHAFQYFEGCWLIPADTRRQGAVLYLHGGGYVSGSIAYAKGFGSALAHECGVRVFCCAYRLAPEHPFPAALEDALESYQYLLSKGYEKIALCGESSGGGLCYALCLQLKELGLPMPSGILAISPWTDLTASGPSYEENANADPTMTHPLLQYYARCYTDDWTNPLVSPLFGDLQGMPPSLIFVGDDEIMRSDSDLLHNKLLSFGCESTLTVAPHMWHGYLLYPLEENAAAYRQINAFLNRTLCRENKLRWVRLDNAAKIYPAARRQNWSNVFRLSATLSEPVDKAILQSALDVTVRRFPTIAARLRRGVFWYYLQQLTHPPAVEQEYAYPLALMDRREVRQCAFRVIVHNCRIAVEFFHSLTDGNGGLVFLKTLLAEYLQEKYGLSIPEESGILDRLTEPAPEEMEDSFLKYAPAVHAGKKESNCWKFQGTPTQQGHLHVVCFQLPVAQVLEKAHACGTTLTGFLCAATMQAYLNLQQEKVPNPRRHKPVKILIPVNLRKLFPSKTVRNFALYTIPEADPRLGSYTFQELCDLVHHKMGSDITPKQMGAMMAANVRLERQLAVRLLPLPIKNFVMKAVFDAVGERKSCLTLSNLGAIRLPEAIQPYVTRMDMILGVQAAAPHNCGIVSYGDTLYINFIRNIQESDLEYHFFRVLQSLGLPVTVESNF